MQEENAKLKQKIEILETLRDQKEEKRIERRLNFHRNRTNSIVAQFVAMSFLRSI